MNKRKKHFFTMVLIGLIFVFSTVGTTKADAAGKIKLSKKKITITEGKSKTIKLKNAKKSKVKWSSTNKKVAKVSAGKIKALKPGKAYIRARYKGKVYKCKVIVKEKKTSIQEDDDTSKDDTSKDDTSSGVNPPSGGLVYLSATGTKYHSINNCGNMNPAKARSMTEQEAINQGYEKCSKCW